MNTSQETRALNRTPAQFFFEVGFGAAYAQGLIQNDMKPPFAFSDALVEHAWEIAGEAHDDPAEFDAYLARANAELTFSNVAHPQGDRAIERIMSVVRTAYACGYTDRPGDRDFSDNEDRLRADLVEALALSPAPDGDYVLVPVDSGARELIQKAADFLDTAAGEGIELDGIDALELVCELHGLLAGDSPRGFHEDVALWLAGKIAPTVPEDAARPSTPKPDNIGALRAICEEVVEVSRGGLDTVAFLVALKGIAKRAAVALSPTPTDMGEAS